jgi:coatomer protein complex subunit epsilon
LLLNGLAVAKMQQGLFEEAETHLNDALKHTPMDPDTLANLIAVAQHLGRPTEVINRYLS